MQPSNKCLRVLVSGNYAMASPSLSPSNSAPAPWMVRCRYWKDLAQVTKSSFSASASCLKVAVSKLSNNWQDNASDKSGRARHPAFLVEVRADRNRSWLADWRHADHGRGVSRHGR